VILWLVAALLTGVVAAPAAPQPPPSAARLDRLLAEDGEEGA